MALNASYDPVEERWKAGQFETLVRDKGYYQAAFHSRLAQKIAALGYGIERDGNSFRLVGIDRATCEEFSRRTEIIEKKARELGITDPDVKGKLGQWTREAKPEEQMDIRELRKEWLKRLGDGQRDAIVEARRGQETAALGAKEAVDYALSDCFERAIGRHAEEPAQDSADSEFRQGGRRGGEGSRDAAPGDSPAGIQGPALCDH